MAPRHRIESAAVLAASRVTYPPADSTRELVMEAVGRLMDEIAALRLRVTELENHVEYRTDID